MTDEINEEETEAPSQDRATPPVRDRRWRVLGNLGWALSGAVLALLIAAVWGQTHGEAGMDQRSSAADAGSGDRKILFYRNPMDPTITSPVAMQDEMGMDYVPVYADETPGAEGKILFYRNPMDPDVTSPAPMKDEMGMDYVPVYEDETPGAERKILFYRNPMDPTITSPVPIQDEMGMDYVPVYEDEVPGRSTDGATVSIDPRMVQNMNVRFEKVERGDLTREVRTVGYLEYDQQKMVTVTTKYAGFVERVHVNYIGEEVRKGQPLFDIYSPELVQTQQDLLSALAFSAKMAGGAEEGGGRPMAEARGRADALVGAARARLGYWDISPEQIEHLEKTGEVVRAMTVTAPAGGVVMKRADGLEGMSLKPGMDSFHIADLSSLWLSVEVFEDQLGWIQAGSVADIDLSYFPGETFSGRVRFVEPQVTERTRTVPLRLEVRNPSRRLRSGMYATVRFHPVVAKDAITVPSLAVLRTGQRNIVVVSVGDGRFAPREVVLGHEGDGKVQVLKGLEEGEEIVTSAQFLIDSESSLREAIQKMVAAARSK